MTRFSLHDEGTSGRKRKKRSNEEEDDLKKRTCVVEAETSESLETEEEEASNEIGDEGEDVEEIEATGEDREFKFSIDPDVLDCSICFEPLRPPIFECINGHIACSHCSPKLLNKCHSCGKPIGRRRCLALEKVIESISSPCQYANYGCRAVLSFTEKASHEEACSHAAFFCPISNCTFSGTMSNLVLHARESHKNISKKFYDDETFLVVLEKQQPLMVLFGSDFHFFLLLNNHEIFPGGNALSVICLTNNTECEFTCELGVTTKESSLRLRTSVVKMKKWDGVHPCKASLVVPDGFDSTNARLHINVCISKSLSSGVLK